MPMKATSIILASLFVSSVSAVASLCSDVSLANAFNAGLAVVKNSGQWASLYASAPSVLMDLSCSSDPANIPFPPARIQRGMGMGMGMGPNQNRLEKVLNSGVLKIAYPFPRESWTLEDTRAFAILHHILEAINTHYETNVVFEEAFNYGTSEATLESVASGTNDMTIPYFSGAGRFRGVNRGLVPHTIQASCATELYLGNVMVLNGFDESDLRSNPSVKFCTGAGGAGTQAVYSAVYGVVVNELPNVLTTRQDQIEVAINQVDGCNAWPGLYLSGLLNTALNDGSENPADVATLQSMFTDVQAAFVENVVSFLTC